MMLATAGIFEMDVNDLKPSPENEKLYRPVDSHDPDVQALADSVREFGLKEPIVVSADGWILSGHRRHMAARLAGLGTVPCRVEPIFRETDRDGFVRLLREHNRQRVKTRGELWREELASVSRDNAYQALLAYRHRESGLSGCADLSPVRIGRRRGRSDITRAKLPMLNAVIDVLNDRRKFWPVSVRQVHYALLNDPPAMHASRPNKLYTNDQKCYKSLCDLLTRARLSDIIPFCAIGDETRPFISWDVWPGTQPFIRDQLGRIMQGYWRDYQQSQPNHVEIVAEKLTVRGAVQPVAQDYCIPVTIGRGYCSIGPRHDMATRYANSGRDQLVILMLSDFDPDGENIAESFARSMRDDFDIDGVVAIKVALTAEQVEQLRLPPRMKAKTGSSTYHRFVQQHGDDVFELEAVPPDALQRVLRAAIEEVLDMDALRDEREQEREDARFLEAKRQRVISALKDEGDE